MATAVSAMRLEKPHSLSYQATTRPKVPAISFVWSGWSVAGLPSHSSGFVYWPAFALVAPAAVLVARTEGETLGPAPAVELPAEAEDAPTRVIDDEP